MVLIEQNLQWTAASLVVMKEVSCSLSHHAREQGALGTVSFSVADPGFLKGGFCYMVARGARAKF